MGRMQQALHLFMTGQFTPIRSKPATNAGARLHDRSLRQQSIFEGGESVYGRTSESYDEVMALVCLQGLINREAPILYFLDASNSRPEYWLDLLSKKGRWLHGKRVIGLNTFEQVLDHIGTAEGIIIWDPEVPATINVASTIAAIKNGVVCSPEFATRHGINGKLPVLMDLRGRFTGAETGSKNDAYRWAIREYLAKGLCSSRRAFLTEDAYFAREHGNPGYVVSRDWVICNRAFVFDLSPWGDEAPADDRDQKRGTDLETYRLILSELYRQAAGRHMTEVVGFFAFDKYSNTQRNKSIHDPVPTELESIWLMSPYNCYDNSISTGCYNQSFHSHFRSKQLRQHFAPVAPRTVEKKAYICVAMADYDSAGLLYEYLPRAWDHADRGEVPLAWGVNPNLVDSYPDLMDYFYATATPLDTFTSDANGAGYIMVNRIRREELGLFVRHSKYYFERADITIAPMVIDFDQPTPAAKDVYSEFASDGMACVIDDTHSGLGKPPAPQVWKGMPVMEMINDASASIEDGKFIGADRLSAIMEETIVKRGNKEPGFYFYRITWVTPRDIIATMTALRARVPELDIELLDPHSFLSLFKQAYSG